MKHIFKKNQVIITGLAVMIAVAGYLNYSGTRLEKEASSTAANDTGSVTSETDTAYIDIESLDQDPTDQDTAELEIGSDGTDTAGLEADSADVETVNDGTDTASAESEVSDTPGEAVLTSLSGGAGIAAEAKMTREQIRAKNKETLLEVINNVNISEEQKQEAIDSMTSMTAIAEKEAAAELLLESKGFTDSVVSITDGTADVVVSQSEITDAQRAQIEDIVKRKTEVSGENIVITTQTAASAETTETTSTETTENTAAE